MKKIFVTGATGFIGKNLVQKLHSLGHEVRCLVRDERRANKLLPKTVEIVEGDVTSPAELKKQVEGCSHVFHLAAQVGHWDLTWQQYERTNVDGTRHIIDACEAAGVELLIHGSTSGVIGFDKQPVPDDDTDSQPFTPYEASKLEAERLILKAVQDKRIKAIVARLDFVYGPDDMQRLPFYSAVAKGRFFIAGPDDSIIRPTYIQDAVDGLIACLQHPSYSGEIFNICGPDEVTAKELVDALQAALGVDAKVVRIPKFMACAGALVFEGISLVTGKPSQPSNKVRLWSAPEPPSTEKAKILLGYSAETPLNRGMAKTAAWFRSITDAQNTTGESLITAQQSEASP